METAAPTPPIVKRPPWWRRVPSFKRLFIFTLFMVTLGVVGLTTGLSYIKTWVPKFSETGGGDVLGGPISFVQEPGKLAFSEGKERMNILVLGIDYNHDEKSIIYTKGARSDTMMVVTINKRAEFLNVVSIPRDTQVLISESLGTEKINAAYSLGGVKQAMETVSQFLGVPIDHYVIVKVYGAQKVIDALGGVAVDVEKDMDYDDNWGGLHIHLKKGPQELKGDQLVGYCRFRKDEEGDRGRMRRQQQVIRVLVSQLKSPSIVMKIPKLAQAVKQTLETDLVIPEMIDLAHLYAQFDQKKIRSAQVVGDDADVNGVSMIIPYGPENEKIVRRLLKDNAELSMKEVRVRVLNGSKEVGAAEHMADELNLDGFNIVKVDRADKDTYKTTEVLEHIKNPRMHGRLTRTLPGVQFKESVKPNSDYDITIIVGNDKPIVNRSVDNSTASTQFTPPAYDASRGGQTNSYHHEEAPRPEETPAEEAVYPRHGEPSAPDPALQAVPAPEPPQPEAPPAPEPVEVPLTPPAATPVPPPATQPG